MESPNVAPAIPAEASLLPEPFNENAADAKLAAFLTKEAVKGTEEKKSNGAEEKKDNGAEEKKNNGSEQKKDDRAEEKKDNGAGEKKDNGAEEKKDNGAEEKTGAADEEKKGAGEEKNATKEKKQHPTSNGSIEAMDQSVWDEVNAMQNGKFCKKCRVPWIFQNWRRSQKVSQSHP